VPRKKKVVRPVAPEKEVIVEEQPEKEAIVEEPNADEIVIDELVVDEQPEKEVVVEPVIDEQPEKEVVIDEPAVFDFADHKRDPTDKMVEITVWKNQHGTQRLDDPDLKNYSDNGLPSLLIGDEAGTPDGQKLPIFRDGFARERSRKEVVADIQVLLVPRIINQARKSGLTVEFKEVI
jgi:hypothetical protein